MTRNQSGWRHIIAMYLGYSPQFRRIGPGEHLKNLVVGLYVMFVKCFFFSKFNEECWLAPGRVLASSEKNAFCQCHLTFL